MQSINVNFAAAPASARSPSLPAIGRDGADQERRWALESAAGSLVAFDRLARAYQGPLLRFLSRRMENASDAEDVLQETFVCAFRKIAQYDPRWNVSGWLFAIAVRQVATHRRRVPLAEPSARVERPSHAPGPEVCATARDEHERLWSVARAHLKGEQFEALWLYYVEALSVADVALALDRTPLTTKVLLHRARQRLAAHLNGADWSVGTRPAAKGTL